MVATSHSLYLAFMALLSGTALAYPVPRESMNGASHPNQVVSVPGNVQHNCNPHHDGSCQHPYTQWTMHRLNHHISLSVGDIEHANIHHGRSVILGNQLQHQDYIPKLMTEADAIKILRDSGPSDH